MIVQNAIPPYTMKCLGCGKSWEPDPGRDGKHTASSLNRAAHAHTCPEARCEVCDALFDHPNPALAGRALAAHMEVRHPEVLT